MATEKGYSKGKWAGHDHYECDHCQYESHDEEEMKKHVKSKHADELKGGGSSS